MNDSRKTIMVVVAVVALALAAWSGWRFFGGSSSPSMQERMNTQSGPITPMSSMFGPDASGRPRTTPPPGVNMPAPPPPTR